MINDPENNQTLKDALKVYGLKQDIRRIHNEMMPALKKKAPVRSIFSYANRIAAAILVLIISAGTILYFTSTPSNLFDSRYEPYLESAQRGGAAKPSEIKRSFLEGQKMLREGNAAQALNTFSEIIRKNALSQEKILNDDAEYYLALSYLKAGQADSALPIFKAIHDNANHLYNDKVTEWFLLRVKIASWREK